jgi:hypothetical protein
MGVSKMDEWLKRYRRDYESLPPLASFPESEREAESQRRESIRKALYALPDAPKPNELSDLEKNVQSAKADLIASWINGAWCREDQTLFHTWWRVHDFAGEYRPEFNDETLERKSRNLAKYLWDPTVERHLGGSPTESTQGLPEKALKAVLDGGMAGVLNLTTTMPAKVRISKVMEELIGKNEKYIEWTLNEWETYFKASRTTIVKTEAWKEIMKRRASNKANRFRQP